MKLTDDVYLVGGGDYGFNLTHRLDCHTYLIDGGSELALVDAGFGPGTDEIIDLIRRDGFDPSRITKILITHYHADHAGGAAQMKRATGARLLAGAEAAPTIRAADADQIGLNWAKTFGFYPADYEWEPAEVEEEFSDGVTDQGRRAGARGDRDPGALRRALLPPPPRARPNVPLLLGLRLLGRSDHPPERSGLECPALRCVVQPTRRDSSSTLCSPAIICSRSGTGADTRRLRRASSIGSGFLVTSSAEASRAWQASSTAK